MNLDQFIKHYLNAENVKNFNNYIKYFCPICDSVISNFDMCLKSNFIHKIEINWHNENICLFLPEINYCFYENYFNINRDLKVFAEFNYKDFGEVTLEKLEKLKDNLLFL